MVQNGEWVVDKVDILGQLAGINFLDFVASDSHGGLVEDVLLVLWRCRWEISARSPQTQGSTSQAARASPRACS